MMENRDVEIVVKTVMYFPIRLSSVFWKKNKMSAGTTVFKFRFDRRGRRRAPAVIPADLHDQSGSDFRHEGPVILETRICFWE